MDRPVIVFFYQVVKYCNFTTCADVADHVADHGYSPPRTPSCRCASASLRAVLLCVHRDSCRWPSCQLRSS